MGARARLAPASCAVAFALFMQGVPWSAASPSREGASGMGAAAPPCSTRVERYVLEITPDADSLAGSPPPFPTREEIQTLAARLRDRLASLGSARSRIKVTLIRGGGDAPGIARIDVEREPGPAAIRASIRGGEEVVPDAARIFERVSAGGAEPGRIQAALEALRAAAQARGRYGAEARVDSVTLEDSSTVRVYVRFEPGPPLTLDTLEVSGAAIRPSVVGAIAGLSRGRVVTPEILEEAKARLQGSDLFASVGDLVVAPASSLGLARVVAPLVENRLSRFEGAVGVQNGGGLTGLVDLAVGNIGGSGRSAGARWAGFGAGRSEYIVRYREPSLFRSAIDAAVALEAQVADSLYTQTRWSLEVAGRPAPRARASAALRRTGSAYTGSARGTSATWSLEGRLAWRGLAPLENPARGVSLSAAVEAGRRTESYPGFERATRGLLRGSAHAEAARPTGGNRVLYGAIHGERVTLGGGALPPEELRFLGGSEGLRGHRDRAFAGDRVLAGTLEHRWLTDGRGGRAFLFVDAARHDLSAPVEAGGTRGSLGASLARTVLSPGWEFGYGAGLRSPTRAGTVGVELGLRPGAPLRESKLHLHFTTDW